MIKKIKIESSLQSQLNQLCERGAYEAPIILKGMTLLVMELWFEEEGFKGESWEELFRLVQKLYEGKEKLINQAVAVTISLEEIVFEMETIDDQAWCDLEQCFNKLLKMYVSGQCIGKIQNILPDSQLEIRREVNHTQKNIKTQCLHEEVFEYAKGLPNKAALEYLTNEHQWETMTYKSLKEKALKLSGMLKAQGVKKGDILAVNLPKGPWQIIAVLGIMAIGGAYVPIGIHQPKDRVEKILKTGNITYMVTLANHDETFIDDTKIMVLEESESYQPLEEAEIVYDKSLLAYVIFTSGTTGVPKGVMITHEAASNTINDIRDKFVITSKDAAMGVSELDFDLSVFDIFGLLGCGGTLVVLNEQMKREPAYWVQVIEDKKVTIWNSVPALFEMLLLTAKNHESSHGLRLALLSGDWIKKDLYSMTKKVWKDCIFVGLGGATEAAIWSNYHVVDHLDSKWQSIPYGKPLANQKFRIVNASGRDCPNKVPGELWIGGAGVALGYLNNEQLTHEKFVTYEGERWYQTGDLGSYDQFGVIEFLGRKDFQVKLNGYRIETGEVDAALKKEDMIQDAVTVLVKNQLSSALVSYIVPQVFISEELEYETLKIKGADIEETIEQQRGLVENFLLHYFEKYNIKTDQELNPVLQFWLDWLIARDIFVKGKQAYEKGPRFQEAATKEVTNTRLLNIFKSHSPLIDGIIHGTQPVSALIEIEELSPESISFQDEGLKQGIAHIAEKLQRQTGDEKLKVAIIDGKAGIATQMLLQHFERPDEIMAITVFEDSPWYEEKAKSRLKDYASCVSYSKMPKDCVSDKTLYEFDYVLAFNTLHTYHEGEGLRTPLYLLKDEGQLIFIEYTQVVPVAYITTALLVPDFIDKIQQKQKIFYTLPEWAAFLHQYGYEQVQGGIVGSSFCQYIEAMPSKKRKKVLPSQILNHIAKELPEYMLPAQIRILHELPLTHNGKVDRKALMGYALQNTKEGTLPKEGMEMEIANMWKSYLHLEKLYREQSFFEVGGDSLLATRFIADLKEKYCIDLTLKTLFLSPKLCDVADEVIRLQEEIGDLVEGTI